MNTVKNIIKLLPIYKFNLKAFIILSGFFVSYSASAKSKKPIQNIYEYQKDFFSIRWLNFFRPKFIKVSEDRVVVFNVYTKLNTF